MERLDCPTLYRPTWAEVDLNAIAHNMRVFKGLYPKQKLMAVVKADGYGHGALSVARTALAAGADWLGVALLEEAVDLRKGGIDAPILVLGYTSPSEEALLTAVRYRIRLTVYEEESLARMGKLTSERQLDLLVHLKVDTGMGRIGLRETAEVISFAERIKERRWLHLEGLFTHFATADEADKTFALLQMARFQEAADALSARGLRPPLLHCANSAAAIDLPEAAFDMLRIGISLYGIYPSHEVRRDRVKLEPAMSFKSQVVQVKRMRRGEPVSYGCTYRVQEQEEQIATLPVGYADGYARRLSNVGSVLIQGTVCPVVGRICMDQTMVRLPRDLAVTPGEEAVLFGRQADCEITADDVAQRLGTIPYEVVCAVGKRVPRVYLE